MESSSSSGEKVVPDARSQRLMISNMILENFKSYAGVQEIGPFHKSFSSIVGPNGSGKSNVIDAMLFVFGKKAKQLRLNKVSELIHKSKNFPDLQYAKVTVFFQMIYEETDVPEGGATGDSAVDSDAFEVVPGSHFVVSRVAGKDNTSKYTVDGKNTTYTEVGKLLRKVGIDLDNNRFLILQGEVEQIAMMKPKGATQHDEGLLEYLEDIIGSNTYVEKIAAVDVRLTELNEVRAAKLRLVRHVEKERDNLEGAKDEAEAFIEQERKIRRKQNHLFQAHALDTSRVLQETGAKCDAATSELAAEKERLSGTDTELNAMKATYDTTVREYEEVCAEVTRATDEFTAFERRDVKLQEDMKHSKAGIKKMQSVLVKDSNAQAEGASAAEGTRAEVERLEGSMEGVVQRQAEAEAALDGVMAGLKEATAVMRVELEGVKEKLIDAKRIVSGVETEKEGVAQTLSLSQARHTKATKGLEKACAKLDSVRSQLAECHTKLQGADGEQSAAVRAVAAFEEELMYLHGQEEELKLALRAAVSAAEEGKASMQSSSGRSGTLDVILKAGRKGGPLAGCGVRGRLGDLGSIADQYDVAISTACGQLDNIVVDTTAGAQKCVKFLRDNNAGRASFLVLDQMQDHARRMGEPKQLPEGCPRLFDLVRTDDAYRAAFYMALRDTLVAPNLDAAVKVAFVGGRAQWRVVTVDGNLVDTTGAMSGGGKSVKSGGMKSKPVAAAGDVSPAQIQQLEAEASRLTGVLSKSRADKAAAQRGLEAARKQVKQLSHSFEKARIATESLTEQVQQLEERAAVLGAEATPTAEETAEAASLATQLAALDAEMERKSPALKMLEAEVTRQQKAILEVGGAKLKAAQAKVDAATRELEGMQMLCSAKEVEQAAAVKAQTRAAAAVAKGEKELAVLTEQLERMQSEQKSAEEEALQVITAVEAAKVLMAEQEAQLATIREKYEAVAAEVEKTRSGIVDMETQVEDFQRVMAESNGRLAYWAKELGGVRKAWAEDQTEELRRMETFEAAEKEAGVYSEAAVVEAAAAAAAAEEAEDKVEMDEAADTATEAVMDVEPAVASEDVQDGTGEQADTVVVKQEQSATADVDASAGAAAAAADADANTEEEGEEAVAVAAVVPVRGLADLRIFSEDNIGGTAAKRLEELKKAVAADEKARDALKANVNLSALMEYRQKTIDHKVRIRDLEEATEVRNACRRGHEELRRQRLEAFMSGFSTITLKLKEMYQMITLGGDAELELVDSLDPFSEGIVFSVRPPKKSWKNISNLSGGEKTLSSLALVFALHHYKPTPLYVMDEIDAALDFKNVSIVANYIKERTKNAQFVIISLRNNMFELADRLVGIYKTHDATKSITINPRTFDMAVAGEAPAHNAVTGTDTTKLVVAAAAVGGEPAEPLGENKHNANANTAPVEELTATMAAASL